MCIVDGKFKWFHSWSKWNKKVADVSKYGGVYSPGFKIPVQERECLRCGKVEIEELKWV